MAIFETFSKRLKKQQRAGQPEVYQYDTLPKAFRVQVVHILSDALGPHSEYSPSRGWWKFIHDTTAREQGKFRLSESSYGGESEWCKSFILDGDTLGVLDIIEIAFWVVDRLAREVPDYARRSEGIVQGADEAITELNHRFREHGIGYQFEKGKLRRVDSQYVHAEVVKPAIALLNTPGFEGPEEEFRKAHEHYRHGRHKEAISEALKAFESTMKVICDGRGWSYPKNATAKPLLDTLVQNGLIPKELESEFGALRSALESGLPTLRNKMGGHGQGSQLVTVLAHFTGFALHLAASNIVFLVEAHKAKKSP